MTRLTQAVVKAAPVPFEGQLFIRDADIRGFALRVTPGGIKAFVWEGRVNGRMRRITLGQHPEMSLTRARAEAMKARIARVEGRDVHTERHGKRRELMFGELVQRYLELHARPKRRQAARIEHRMKTHFGKWYGRQLSDITIEDVTTAHLAIGAARGKAEANRAVGIMRAIFNFGRRTLKWPGANPAEHIEKFPEQARRRFLNGDELIRVNNSLMAETDIYWRAFFPLILFLGTRRGELLSARWADIDLGAKPTLRLPTTKSGEPLLLPLPEAAVRILESLPSRGTSEWLFPSDGAQGHLVAPFAPWDRIRRRAGVPDVTIHDLRRTLGSWLKAGGQDLATIGRVLNHTNMASTAIYARIDAESLRPVLERNARLMLGNGDGVLLESSAVPGAK